jgi:hypothetical protein
VVRATSASGFESSASAAADGLRAELLDLLERDVGSGRYSLRSDSAERARVLELVQALEATTAPPAFPRQLAELDGSWDLLFTTNAISLDANLFGSLAALPAALPSLSPLLDGSPLRTRRVRQEIDVARGRVRNCVTLTAWPEGAEESGVPLPPFLGQILAGLQGSDLTLTLDHAATVEAPMGGELARLRIELQAVKRTLEPGPTPTSAVGAGLLDLIPKEVRAAAAAGAAHAPLRLAAFALAVCRAGTRDARALRSLTRGPRVHAARARPLRRASRLRAVCVVAAQTEYVVPWPLSSLQAGRFDTSYLDPLMRISRGVPPCREVRVFRRSATKAVVVSEGRGM